LIINGLLSGIRNVCDHGIQRFQPRLAPPLTQTFGASVHLLR